MIYDPTTDAGRVRLLVTDTDTDNPIFADAEIDTFLSLAGGSVFLGAALALEAIARNEALVQKVISILDLSTNGAALAAELRASAATLRKQHEDDESGVAVDWAENPDDVFSAREKRRKDARRR